MMMVIIWMVAVGWYLDGVVVAAFVPNFSPRPTPAHRCTTISMVGCICGKAWCAQTTALLEREEPELAEFLHIAAAANGGDAGGSSSQVCHMFRELCFEHFYPAEKHGSDGNESNRPEDACAIQVAVHHFHPTLRKVWNEYSSDKGEKSKAFSKETATACGFAFETNMINELYIVLPNYPRAKLYKEIQIFQKKTHTRSYSPIDPASTDGDSALNYNSSSSTLRELCIEIAFSENAEEYYNTIGTILFHSVDDSKLNEQALHDISLKKSGSITDDSSNVDRDLRFQVVFEPGSSTFRRIETLAAEVGILNPEKSMIDKAVLLVGGTRRQPIHSDIYVFQRDNADDDINQKLHTPDSYCSTILSVQRDTNMSIGVQLDQVHFVGPNLLTVDGDPTSVYSYDPTTFDGVRIGVEGPHGFQFRGDFFHSGMPSKLLEDDVVLEKLRSIKDDELMVSGLKKVLAENRIGHFSRLFLFIAPKADHMKLNLSAEHISYGWEEA